MSENSGSIEINEKPAEAAISVNSPSKEVYSRTKKVIGSLINNLPENEQRINEQEAPVDRVIGNINFIKDLTSEGKPLTDLLLESLMRRGEKANGVVEICKSASKINVPMLSGDWKDYANSIILTSIPELGRFVIERGGLDSAGRETTARLDVNNIRMDHLMNKFSKMSHKDILVQISKNLVPFSFPAQK